jgi:hypothetical protein
MSKGKEGYERGFQIGLEIGRKERYEINYRKGREDALILVVRLMLPMLQQKGMNNREIAQLLAVSEEELLESIERSGPPIEGAE